MSSLGARGAKASTVSVANEFIPYTFGAVVQSQELSLPFTDHALSKAGEAKI